MVIGLLLRDFKINFIGDTMGEKLKACFCDLENEVEPQLCVLDDGKYKPSDCYRGEEIAKHGDKSKCPEWHPLKAKALERKKDPNIIALNELVDSFAEQMKAKLYKKHDEGYTGWDDPSMLPTLELSLIDHAKKDDVVDVANIAAMIWRLRSVKTNTVG